MPLPSHTSRTLRGLTIEETDAQITADHREGKEKVVLTRATARAIYYTLWDLLYEDAPRDHEPHDLARLNRLMPTMSDVGWPHEEEDR